MTQTRVPQDQRGGRPSLGVPDNNPFCDCGHRQGGNSFAFAPHTGHVPLYAAIDPGKCRECECPKFHIDNPAPILQPKRRERKGRAL